MMQVKTNNRVDNFNRLQKFESKKNNVFLCQTNIEGDSDSNNSLIILKEFIQIENYNTEKNIYLQFNKLEPDNQMCPCLYSFKEDRLKLYLEYIKGKTVIEILEDCEVNNEVEIAVFTLVKLLEWLCDFYRVFDDEDSLSFNRGFDLNNGKIKYSTFGLILEDVNFRNFLVKENNIIGIDFECCKIGNRREELVGVVAMYLQYNPVETNFKKSVVNELFKQFYEKNNFSKCEFTQMVVDETNRIIERRKKFNR